MLEKRCQWRTGDEILQGLIFVRTLAVIFALELKQNKFCYVLELNSDEPVSVENRLKTFTGVSFC